MWAATPILTDCVGSLRGPLVSWRQYGFEQHIPTRRPSTSTTDRGKSSTLFATPETLKLFGRTFKVRTLAQLSLATANQSWFRRAHSDQCLEPNEQELES